jgi:predicted membrane protein
MINATLLVLHEIESAYWKEWEILKLPGHITGFIIIHIPILLLMLYGLIEVEKQSPSGNILGLVFGIGGLVPFIVHSLFAKKEDRFNLVISRILIYSSAISGALLLILTVPRLF